MILIYSKNTKIQSCYHSKPQYYDKCITNLFLFLFQTSLFIFFQKIQNQYQFTSATMQYLISFLKIHYIIVLTSLAFRLLFTKIDEVSQMIIAFGKYLGSRDEQSQDSLHLFFRFNIFHIEKPTNKSPPSIRSNQKGLQRITIILHFNRHAIISIIFSNMKPILPRNVRIYLPLKTRNLQISILLFLSNYQYSIPSIYQVQQMQFSIRTFLLLQFINLVLEYGSKLTIHDKNHPNCIKEHIVREKYCLKCISLLIAKKPMFSLSFLLQITYKTNIIVNHPQPILLVSTKPRQPSFIQATQQPNANNIRKTRFIQIIQSFITLRNMQNSLYYQDFFNPTLYYSYLPQYYINYHLPVIPSSLSNQIIINSEPTSNLPTKHQITALETQLSTEQKTTIKRCPKPKSKKTKHRIYKSKSKLISSAKKNSQSNLINQILSYLSRQRDSQHVLDRILLKDNFPKEEIQNIKKIFYDFLKVINLKRERKYINRKTILCLFTPQTLQREFPFINEHLKTSKTIELSQLCRIYRVSIYHYMRNQSSSAILTSKRIQSFVKTIYLKRSGVLRHLIQDKEFEYQSNNDSQQ